MFQARRETLREVRRRLDRREVIPHDEKASPHNQVHLRTPRASGDVCLHLYDVHAWERVINEREMLLAKRPAIH
jgi:hypothetical protein